MSRRLAAARRLPSIHPEPEGFDALALLFPVPELPVTRAPPAPQPQRRNHRALAASILVHLGILGLFMIALTMSSRGEPAPRRIIQGVMVMRSAAASMAPATAPTPPPAAPAAPQTPPPRPAQKPSESARATPPAPAVPAARPAPEKAVAVAAPDRVAEARDSEVPAERTGSQGESSLTLLLDQVRENWLQPAGQRRLFRCRIRIDFRAGGIIANVSVLQGCGDSPLDDSVIRAVWKTQPLPIESARNQDGSVVLDFTP